MAKEITNPVESPQRIQEILRDARRIAVLGIKTDRQAGQPAFYVPEYLQRAGYDILPVPVYYPDVTEILGRPVHRKLADVPGPIDLVIVFRRSTNVPAHLDDFLEARPGAVWLQSGIRSGEAAGRLASAGIELVQDRCAMVEHRRLLARASRDPGR